MILMLLTCVLLLLGYILFPFHCFLLMEDYMMTEVRRDF